MACYLIKGKPRTMTARCEFCQGLIEVGLPMSARKLDEIMTIFETVHKSCKKEDESCSNPET